jgi:hypothetical protein
MNRLTVNAAALVAISMLALLPTSYANAARFYDPAMQAPSLVEDVACRTVRERVVRPNGRVIYRTKRTCDRDWRRPWASGKCRTVRERIVRPNGSVVYRTKRRCR